MNKLEAKNLVFNTFEKSFDEIQFTRFIKNLLNNLDETKRKDYRGNIIPDSFDENIRQYKRIGQYTDSKNNVIDVLVVELKRDTSIERARTLQRNFVARHLRKRNHTAALVAYFTKDFPDWRFSFVKLEYNLHKKDDSKVKIEEELSPAKRYSFLVGANERSHTAQSQFQKILTEILNPTLNELEQAFNIETVTREFFLEYRNLFIRTKLELDKIIENDPKVKAEFSREAGSTSGGDSKTVNSVDFSKKLLGQIIFLYFLQKKGWFGVERDSDWGTGSKKFLRELFDLSAEASAKAEKKHGVNFFNDYLEPLFYEALRMDRSHDDHYYSRFNCKIPFLNGGLFDPIGNYDWVHTDIILPNELFSNKHKTKEGDIGDGILDIFDRYNFTVIEDEPLEKEVAIDPELLGKAYEKFNAIRSDNFDEYLTALKSGKEGSENKFNKQYGVYYTPREIVHYMCRESLINYLASEFSLPAEASAKAGDRTASYEKIGDSQLDAFGNTARKGQLSLEKVSPFGGDLEGAGAFIPKEDIETLINYGELLGENEAIVESKGKETETYYHKLPESIRKNAKLIDEKLADILICDPAVGSGAFPVGMMHEIVSTRNLLSIFINPQADVKTQNFASPRTIYQFKRECIEKSLYGVDIDSGAVEIAKLRLWLSLVVDEDDFKEIKPLPNLDYKIVKGNSLLGFPDGIVKNVAIEKEIESLKEKYFNLTDVNEKRKIKSNIEANFLKLIEEAKNFSDLVIDISFDFDFYFSEVFHQKKGFDIVIANPPYVFTRKSDFSNEFKEYVNKYYFSFIKAGVKSKAKQSGKINLFGLFIMRAFHLLSQKGSLVYIVPNNLLRTTTFDNIRKFLLDNSQILEIVDLGSGIFDEVTASTIIINLKKNSNQDERNSNRISIITSIEDFFNKVYTKSSICQANFLKNVSYSFNLFIDDKTSFLNSKISSDKKLFGSFCKEIIEGIVAHNHLISKEQKKGFLPLLEGKCIKKYSITPVNKYIKWSKKYIHRTRPDYLWSANKKIILQRISGGLNPLTAALDTNKFKTFASINNILLKDEFSDAYEFYLALINSKTLNWYYANNFSNKSDLTVNISKTYLENLPVPQYIPSEHKGIIELVNKIILTKSKDYSHNTIKLENEIDIMVYKLYNLTYEEVKIIDPEIEKIISEKDYEKFEIK